MSEPEATTTRVLVFGSCVARDTIQFASASSVDLRGYIARQSLISARSDAAAHLPESLGIESDFQARMIRADFAGSLLGRLETMAAEIDLLLWDLADERHGVHRFSDGSIVTRSIDTIRARTVSGLLEKTEHIRFGTDEHFGLWRASVDVFAARLRELGLFERTVVLEVPWALQTTAGKTTPWSMGIRAGDANRQYRRYYDYLQRTGYHLLELPIEVVLADPNHKWGLAPFHYTPEVYREVLRQLREVHGMMGPRAVEPRQATREPDESARDTDRG